MAFVVEWEHRAAKEFRGLPHSEQVRIAAKLDVLSPKLEGDVRKLGGGKLGYRLRVGRYRILFKLEGNRLVVYRIRIRGSAYSQFIW